MSLFSETKMQGWLSSYFSDSAVKYDIDGLYVFSWESDKLIETRSGYIYEFEIKVSRADYKNDFKHKQEKHALLGSYVKNERTLFDDVDGKPWMTALSAPATDESAGYGGSGNALRRVNVWDRSGRKKKLPNYFFYAVPEGMIDEDEVPPYAGLVYVNQYGSITTVKKAPQLHDEKYSDVQLNLSEKFYYNMLTAKETARNWQRDYEYAQKRLEHELAAKKHDRTWEQMEADLKKALEDKDYYTERYYKDEVDLCLQRMDIRLLKRELLKLIPDFDFAALEREAEVRSGILHKEKVVNKETKEE